MSRSVDGIVLVHAGHRPDAPGRADPRFPADRVGYVRQRLTTLVEVLRPAGLVTAAAAGADLLAADVAIRAGVPVHVVLPIARARFREVSVVDRGDDWLADFERVVAHVVTDPACSFVEHDLGAGEAGFRAGSGALLDRAVDLDPQRVLAVAVRHRDPHAAASITDDFVDQAEARGLFVVEIDPLPTT